VPRHLPDGTPVELGTIPITAPIAPTATLEFAVRPFEINRHGRIVFPSSYFPDLDLSDFRTLEQFEAAVRRDFDEKSPTGTDIVERWRPAVQQRRFELLRDVALNLFWGNRYVLDHVRAPPHPLARCARHSPDVVLGVAQHGGRGTQDRRCGAELRRAAAHLGRPARGRDLNELLFNIFGHQALPRQWSARRSSRRSPNYWPVGHLPRGAPIGSSSEVFALVCPDVGSTR